MKRVLLLVLCLFIVSVGLMGKTIRIPEDFRTFHEAINSSVDGDTIVLNGDQPGRLLSLLDNVVIDKSLTLRGIGREQPGLFGRQKGLPTILIKSDHLIEVVLEYLVMGGGENTYVDIQIQGRSKVRMENVRLQSQSGKHTGAIVAVSEEAELLIQNSQIEHHNSDGVYAVDSAKLVIEDCLFETGGSAYARAHFLGLLVEDQAVVSVNNSEFSYNTSGLSLKGGRTTVQGCRFFKNESGLHVCGEAEVAVRNCVFSDNETGVSSQGKITIEESDLSNNKVGLEASGSDGTVIANSTISENEDNGVLVIDSHIMLTDCSVNSNGRSSPTGAGVNLTYRATALITGCAIDNNKGWGIRAVRSSVVIGWENSVSGNLRNLYGVSELVTGPKPLESKAIVAVPQDVASLEEAIYLVSDGGTIEISAGKYTKQCLGIYKNMTLQGVNSAQVELSEVGITILPGVERVAIEGITAMSSSEDGIRVSGDTELELSDCVVMGAGDGSALAVNGLGSVSILNSQFSSWRYGISINHSGQITLRGSTVSNNKYGIYSEIEADVRIYGSQIQDNESSGIYWSNSGSLLVEHSEITGSEYGVFIEFAPHVTVSHSSISGNLAGIVVDTVFNGLFLDLEYNEIFDNKYGVVLGGYSHAESFEIRGAANNISNNGTNLRPSVADFPWPEGFGGGA